jgi:hypothetical protein
MEGHEVGGDHTTLVREGLNKVFQTFGVEATRRMEGRMSTDADWVELSAGVFNEHGVVLTEGYVGSHDLLSVDLGSGFSPMHALSFSDGVEYSVGLNVGSTRNDFGVVGIDLELFPALGTVGSTGSSPGIGALVEGGSWESSPKTSLGLSNNIVFSPSDVLLDVDSNLGGVVKYVGVSTGSEVKGRKGTVHEPYLVNPFIYNSVMEKISKGQKGVDDSKTSSRKGTQCAHDRK